MCAAGLSLEHNRRQSRDILLRIACIGTGSETHSAIRVIFTMFGWPWLVVGADLLWEKSITDWLVAGDWCLVWEKNTIGWLKRTEWLAWPLAPSIHQLSGLCFFDITGGVSPTDYKYKRSNQKVFTEEAQETKKERKKINSITSVSIHSNITSFHLAFARRITRVNSFLKF